MIENTNPDSVDGKELFEKDIMLTSEQRRALRERKALSNLVYRWPDGPDGFPLIPYVMDTSVDVMAVVEGQQHWMDHTCIKFTATTNTDQPHLRFIKDSGCWSYLGRIYYWNGQSISIGEDCTSVGNVAHEIGHAIGFYHEQSRSDRDTYVSINYENIPPGKESNFEKVPESEVNNYGVPYDYTSLMHYYPLFYSMNGKPTISTTDPFAQGLIGQRDGLSHRDKLLANRMYNCTGKWLASCGFTFDPCQNDGYLGARCTCVCPSGTSGRLCEVVTGGYYDNKLSECSATITHEGFITSPNFPENYDEGTRCTLVIRAPPCYRPRIIFDSFQLYWRENHYYDNYPICCYDYLQIRTNNITAGELYCGDDIFEGQEFTAASDTLILFFSANTNCFSGWSAHVCFVHSPECSYKGKNVWKSSSPNFSPVLMFRTDARNNNMGFNISVCPNTTSCHKYITVTTGGSDGYEQTPNFFARRKHSELTHCEWWIEAPVGKRIIINMMTIIHQTRTCKTDYVVVNGRGDKTYPAATSKIYCGTHIRSFTSTNNTVYIAYQGQKNRSTGMMFSYTVV
ncbi:blastula protease 10-like [Cherax quadricarinatus]|uniref:blastula protease 10-like n=1 Tax=Cherax quadricarinatus TaxID=27406 RepID=UPI00387ECA4E